MLEKYKIPKNSMLMDIQYIREDKKNKIPDVLYIIWKDLNTLKKHLLTIEHPTVKIYFEKPEYRNHPYPRTYQFLPALEEREVPYAEIQNAIIADDTSGECKRIISDAYKTRDFAKAKQIFLYPYVFGADFPIEALYRFYWFNELSNDEIKPITKGFADIETDFLHANGFPEPTTCPIDLITLVDQETKTSYTFALVLQEYKKTADDIIAAMSPKEAYKTKRRDERFEAMYAGKHKQQEYLMSHQDDLKKELHEMFDDTYDVFDYRFFFYEDERKMLIHFFQLVNTIKLDFLEFWNFSFDIPYICKRAEHLRIDPKSLFCHPDFKRQQCYFKEDIRHFDIKNKTDFFYCNSYTTYLCQMRTYASIRKGKSEVKSFRLNYIGQKELKDEKIDYTDEGGLKTLSYVNFKKYVIYNIKDVLLQFGIERVTSDLENVYMTAYQTITPYDSIFKQTVKLRNVQYQSYYEQGLVPGSNTNIFVKDDDKESDDDEVGFEGALVGDPRLNQKVGAKLYGKKTNNIFEYGIDMDMGAFYPSTIRIFNIDPTTLIFKCKLDASQFTVNGGSVPIHTISHIPLLPDKTSDFVDDVGKECFDNLQTRNYLSMGEKWFNLPDMNEMYQTLLEKFKEG